MKQDAFLKRLAEIGVGYECVHCRINGNEVEIRYLTYNGKTCPVDKGDLAFVTKEVLRRVCSVLGLSDTDFKDAEALN